MTLSNISQEMIMNYCRSHSNDNSQILKEIEKHTWDNEKIPQMMVSVGSHKTPIETKVEFIAQSPTLISRRNSGEYLEVYI